MKYLIPAIILILIGITLCFCFGCSRSEVSPGQTWVYIPNRDNPNPFESETRCENKVLEVKKGWVKYLSNRYENNRLTNSTIETDMIFWFLIDSKLKEATLLIDDVRVYEILPDGTKKEIVVPPSKGREVKEKENQNEQN